MWRCRSADVKVWRSRSAGVRVWRSRSAGVRVWRSRSADVKVWRSRSADVKVWRSRSAGVKVWRCRSADVKVWRCRSADVKVWRCSITAAFLRRTLRRRSREKLRACWRRSFHVWTVKEHAMARTEAVSATIRAGFREGGAGPNFGADFYRTGQTHMWFSFTAPGMRLEWSRIFARWFHVVPFCRKLAHKQKSNFEERFCCGSLTGLGSKICQQALHGLPKYSWFQNNFPLVTLL